MESISIKKVFSSMWTSPKEVFTYIHKNHFERYFYLILFLAGVAKAFERSIVGSDQAASLTAILSVSVIAGGLFGWTSLLLYSLGVEVAGKFMGGKADTWDIFRVVAYAMIPSILGLLLLIPEVSLFGLDIFGSNWNVFTDDLWRNLLGAPLVLLHLGLQVFSLYLCVQAIAAVQGFSFGEAVLNAIIPFVLIFLFAVFAFGIMMFFSWLFY